jgi:hypothetical protein
MEFTIIASSQTPFGAIDFDVCESTLTTDLMSFCLKIPNPHIKLMPLRDEYCRLGGRTDEQGWDFHFFDINSFSVREPVARHPSDVVRQAARARVEPATRLCFGQFCGYS